MKTPSDSLIVEDKTQMVAAESKRVREKLIGKQKCSRARRMTSNFVRTVKESRFKNQGGVSTKAGVNVSRNTTLRCVNCVTFLSRRKSYWKMRRG